MTAPDPNRRSRPAAPAPAAAGFSLTELLVVVGIMAVLFVLAAPVVNSLVDSNRLSQGGQNLSEQINLARQTASSRNRAVEVRLIRVPDHSEQGYSAVQLWMADDSGQMREMSRLATLPTAVTIAENTNLSEVLPSLNKGTMEAGAMAGQEYVAFQVRPTGMVIPAPPPPDTMKNFFLTVVPIRSANASTLPDNYVMVQVNPLTATPLVYRP
jgi:uncharacterized protein (TIGR02596 family)